MACLGGVSCVADPGVTFPYEACFGKYGEIGKPCMTLHVFRILLQLAVEFKNGRYDVLDVAGETGGNSGIGGFDAQINGLLAVFHGAHERVEGLGRIVESDTVFR